MALLFSQVRVSIPNGNEAEFLVSGIPQEMKDFDCYIKFENFLDNIEENTEISVHAEVYLYGEGETFKASIEEVAYFHLRMLKDGRLQPSSAHWTNWGTMSHGRCLTARIITSPNPERDSSLSPFLEPFVPARYWLSWRQAERLVFKSLEADRATESMPLKD